MQQTCRWPTRTLLSMRVDVESVRCQRQIKLAACVDSRTPRRRNVDYGPDRTKPNLCWESLEWHLTLVLRKAYCVVLIRVVDTRSCRLPAAEICLLKELTPADWISVSNYIAPIDILQNLYCARRVHIVSGPADPKGNDDNTILVHKQPSV